jgi:hypothetical protein
MSRKKNKVRKSRPAAEVDRKPSAEIVQGDGELRRRGTLVLELEEQSYLDARVRDVEVAAQRCRLIYLAISAISMMLVSVAFNQAFSWTRLIAEGLHDDGFKEGDWTNQLQLRQMVEWTAGLQFDLPYLGGRFGASDAGVVGGVLLLIAGLWAYFALRRENHVVYFLVKDVHEFRFSAAARFYLRSQIYATQLFMQGRHGLPYSDKNILDKEWHEVWRKSLSSRIKRIAPSIIFFLPALSLLFVFIIDVRSLSTDSPFRQGDELLIDYLCELKPLQTCEQFHHVLWRLGGSVALLLLVYFIMRAAYQIQRGTTSLVDFTATWKNPLVRERWH